MALVGNYTLLNRTSIRTFAGTATSMTPFNYSPPASLRNRLSKYGQVSGTPYGYLAPVSWVLPNAGGAMSSYNPAILNLVTVSADAKMGLNMVASAALVLTLVNAQADQIVSLEADAVLSLVKVDAAMTAGVDATADAAMTLTPSASLGGIIPVTADAVCALTPSVDMTALAFMEAEAGGPTDLSPEGLANAVWDTALSDHQTTGSAGKILTQAKQSADNAFAVSS
jgi:hypothetical protein